MVIGGSFVTPTWLPTHEHRAHQAGGRAGPVAIAIGASNTRVSRNCGIGPSAAKER